MSIKMNLYLVYRLDPDKIPIAVYAEKSYREVEAEYPDDVVELIGFAKTGTKPGLIFGGES